MLVLPQIKRELFAEKTRIAMTILAIAWGTFAIATMLAIGQGLRTTFAAKMASTGHNLLMLKPGRSTKAYRGKHANIAVKFTRRDLHSIAQLPNIAALSPIYNVKTTTIRYQNKVLPQTILAVGANYAKIHEIKVLLPGGFISPLDITKHRFVIVLGTKATSEFFPSETNPIGKAVYIGGQAFSVIGVMRSKTQLMGRGQSDALSNWIPETTYRMMVNPQSIDGIDLTYINPERLLQLESHIQQAVALSHGANPNDNNLVHFRDYSRRQERINTFFFGLQTFLGIIGALTLLIAGVGIANVMYASVNRATHEIGIRMAIGARTYQVILHYVIESLMTTCIGGVLGLIMSWLVVFGLRQIHLRGRLIQIIGHPRPELSFGVIVIVIVVLGLVGLLAGLFPALKAAKVDPAEALSYE